jgi:hypothetical protein
MINLKSSKYLKFTFAYDHCTRESEQYPKYFEARVINRCNIKQNLRCHPHYILQKAPPYAGLLQQSVFTTYLRMHGLQRKNVEHVRQPEDSFVWLHIDPFAAVGLLFALFMQTVCWRSLHEGICCFALFVCVQIMQLAARRITFSFSRWYFRIFS